MVEFEASNNTQIEQGMRKIADRGASLIVAMGFAQADAVAAVAPEQLLQQHQLAQIP